MTMFWSPQVIGSEIPLGNLVDVLQPLSAH